MSETSKAVMMYRIVNSLIEIPTSPYLMPATRSEYKFVQPPTRIDNYKFSFFPSAVRTWNSLPAEVAQTSSIDSFKTAMGSLGSALC